MSNWTNEKYKTLTFSKSSNPPFDLLRYSSNNKNGVILKSDFNLSDTLFLFNDIISFSDTWGKNILTTVDLTDVSEADYYTGLEIVDENNVTYDSICLVKVSADIIKLIAFVNSSKSTQLILNSNLVFIKILNDNFLSSFVLNNGIKVKNNLKRSRFTFNETLITKSNGFDFKFIFKSGGEVFNRFKLEIVNNIKKLIYTKADTNYDKVVYTSEIGFTLDDYKTLDIAKGNDVNNYNLIKYLYLNSYESNYVDFFYEKMFIGNKSINEILFGQNRTVYRIYLGNTALIYESKIKKLDTPTNVSLDDTGDIVSFDDVPNAERYELYFTDVETGEQILAGYYDKVFVYKFVGENKSAIKIIKARLEHEAESDNILLKKNLK